MSAAAATSVRSDFTPRRWAMWTVVTAGGSAVVVLAVRSLAAAPPTGTRAILGIVALLAAAWAAERWPLPTSDGEMSLAMFATVCAGVLYGGSVSALIAAAAFLVAVNRRIDPRKLVFNASMFALMGGASGLAAHAHHHVGVMGAALLAAAAAFIVNVGLIAMILADGNVRDAARLAWSRVGVHIMVPTVLTLSVAPLYIITWQSHPAIAVLAVAPLIAIGMQLRAADEARRATAVSLTDALTGLGNRRALDGRLERELDRTDQTGTPLSVCMLDLDGFKEINDAHGHDAGDRALSAVAELLRRDGEAFRYGGDEFVLVLPGRDRAEAVAVGEAVRERIRELDLSVSVGVATYPADGMGRDEFVRTADQALYRRKRLS